MNNPIILNAPAKINLNLKITGRRDDGYHLLDSVVIFAALADRVMISEADQDSVSVTGSISELIDDGNTSLHKARDTFRKKTGWQNSIQIALEKHIPVAAGLGGGSADAAAVLRGLEILYSHSHDSNTCQIVTETDLMEMALDIGADVPVLMQSWKNKAVRMQGIGEKLLPMPFTKEPGILLVNPGVELSTAKVFDVMREHQDADMLVPTIPSITPSRMPIGNHNCKDMDLATQIAHGNDMTQAAISLAPIIETTLRMLDQCVDENNGYGAAMSGSGATCFALFPTIEDAKQAQITLNSLVSENVFWCWAGSVMESV